MKTYKKHIIAVLLLLVLGSAGNVMARTYEVDTAITAVTITSPNDNDPVYAGQEYTLTCSNTSVDRDRCVEAPYGYVWDTIVYTWSGPGTFDPETGPSVTWTAPSADGNAVIYVTASDDDSPPAYANDVDVNDSITLIVTDVIYVNEDANGNDDGTSWTDAFNYLQDALLGGGAATSGDQIWVAEGTYKPTADANRAVSFELIDGVAMYGGFDPNGGDDTWAERDWENNVTILSGDINSVGDNTDNSYHVVHSEDCNTNTVLDGFTLTAGNANSDYLYDMEGGGMYNGRFSSPTVTNCIFSGNTALRGGGGMRNYWFSSPTVTNCTFSGNAATSWGGAMWSNNYCEPIITNCVFFWNLAENYEGGINNGGSALPGYSSSISNCTFVGNIGGNKGALLYSHDTFTLTNSILWANSATNGGTYGEIYFSNYDEDANLTISHCNIEGGWNGPKVYDPCDDITDGGGNISSDPCFVNIFDFSDMTKASGTTTTINVTDANLYAVDDEIEYNNDGVARKVTGVNTTTDVVTFANDALSASSEPYKSVFNWGSGATDMDEDLHILSASGCKDAGDPNGTYTDQKDMDDEDRVNGSEVDIGADEYYSP